MKRHSACHHQKRRHSATVVDKAVGVLIKDNGGFWVVDHCPQSSRSPGFAISYERPLPRPGASVILRSAKSRCHVCSVNSRACRCAPCGAPKAKRQITRSSRPPQGITPVVFVSAGCVERMAERSNSASGWVQIKTRQTMIPLAPGAWYTPGSWTVSSRAATPELFATRPCTASPRWRSRTMSRSE